jgi:signal transduction histidine kinase
MVKKIAEAHNGRVEVESEPGRTCFRLILPVSRQPATEATP